MAAAALNESTLHRWARAWPDGLAFVAGLGMAWGLRWETRDLVWSLWLSSLVVGYAMIGWTIFGPAVFAGFQRWCGRAAQADLPRGPLAPGGVAYLLGGLFLLAFFTVHFGLFHFVHSVFLNHFFPASTGMKAGPSFALYATVFTKYWPFVLVSAVAERSAFRWGPSGTRIGLPGAVGEAVDGADLKPREVRVAGMGGMMAPYKNVVRLHLLIFFFAGASFLKLDRFAVYAVVYAVYFFPWRLVRKAQVNS